MNSAPQTTHGPGSAPYIAVLLYETTGLAEPWYREDMVLLWASDEAQGRRLAAERGAHESFGYIGGEGHALTQRLKHVIDVAPATDADLSGHADLYSREISDYSSYRAWERPVGAGESDDQTPE